MRENPTLEITTRQDAIDALKIIASFAPAWATYDIVFAENANGLLKWIQQQGEKDEHKITE